MRIAPLAGGAPAPAAGAGSFAFRTSEGFSHMG